MKSDVLKNQGTVLSESADYTLVYFDHFLVYVPAQKRDTPKGVIFSNIDSQPYCW